ncbi:MAG: hypothetical protein PHF21_04580, partial [Bacilli bacterium]|nr:hypothetical protein [Bacilli bacterium]
EDQVLAAKKLHNDLINQGIRSELWDQAESMNKKILEDLELKIAKVIEDYSKLVPKDVEGLCKVHSINIKQILKSKNIMSHKINSLDLGADYEHYFLLIDNRDDFILIDLTYSQFNSKGKTLITTKLERFPSDVLCETEKGRKLYADLINKGYSLVNIEEITLYLNCFNIYQTITIDDLLFSASK